MAETRTLTLTIDDKIDRELETLAIESGHDKQDIVLEALREWLEDREDVRHAVETLARNEGTLTSTEVRRELGLDD
jgi:predicted DNA-binding protein